MFVGDSNKNAIDAIQAVGIEQLQVAPTGEIVELRVKLAYYNSTTHIGYGTATAAHCPRTHEVGMISTESMEKLQAFLNSVEKDFGTVLFGAGYLQEDGIEKGDSAKAESSEGLTPSQRKKGLGGGV